MKGGTSRFSPWCQGTSSSGKLGSVHTVIWPLTAQHRLPHGTSFSRACLQKWLAGSIYLLSPCKNLIGREKCSCLENLKNNTKIVHHRHNENFVLPIDTLILFLLLTKHTRSSYSATNNCFSIPKLPSGVAVVPLGNLHIQWTNSGSIWWSEDINTAWEGSCSCFSLRTVGGFKP